MRGLKKGYITQYGAMQPKYQIGQPLGRVRSKLNADREYRNRGSAKIFGSKGRPARLDGHGAKKTLRGLVRHDRISSLSELDRIVRVLGASQAF